MSKEDCGMNMAYDPQLLQWRTKYVSTLKLACGWDCNVFFDQGCRELTDRLKVLAASGTVQPEAIETMRGYLKALLNTQEKWLLRESAMIEAAGAGMQ